MANQKKSLWLVFILVAAGILIVVLTLGQNKNQAPQGVELKDILSQKPQAVAQPSPVKTVSEPTSPSNPAASDPVPAMAIVTTPEGGHEAGFTIQVYSFLDKARAEAALEALRNEGYQAFMVMSDLGEKGTWYRIRVGGIPDEAAAQKALSDIRKSYNSGFIVKPKK